MSTEILSTSLGEALILKDVIPLAQGLGSAALMESQKPGWPTDWKGAKNELPKVLSSDSVRITMGGGGDEVSGDVAHNLLGGDNTDGSESYDPFPKVNASLHGGEEGGELYSLAGSARITASYEGDDWPDDDRPKRKRDIDEDEALRDDSVRITMGSDVGDNAPWSPPPPGPIVDPFRK